MDRFEVIKRGHYDLPGGESTSYYLDGRLLSMHPAAGRLIARAMNQHLPNDVNSLGGPATAAIPLVAALSAESNLPGFYVRLEAKEYGLQNRIEGHCAGNVVMIDDTVNTAQSVIDAIAVVEAGGCAVVKVLSIFNRRREDGSGSGNSRLRHMGYACQSLFTVADGVVRVSKTGE